MGRESPAQPLWEGKAGADSAPSLPPCSPCSGRGFHRDWTGLISGMQTHRFWEVFSCYAAVINRQTDEGVPRPQVCVLAQANESVHPGSFHQAQNVLQVCAKPA